MQQGFPETNGEINDLGFEIKDYADAVIKIARLYQMSVVQLYEELKWDANNCALYIADKGEFLHSNKAGARQMAEIIGKKLPKF